MLSISTILLILFTHFVADFFCQTHEMAVNKSKSVKWLSYHVGVYTIVLLISSFIVFIFTLTPPVITLSSIVCYALLNGVLHWITDFFTSKWTAYLWKKQQVHNFFVVVGIDQMIHYSCLFLTLKLFI
jgi:hypothetical protein